MTEDEHNRGHGPSPSGGRRIFASRIRDPCGCHASGIPSREAPSPRNQVNGSDIHRDCPRVFWDVPIRPQADPYRMGLGHPLGFTRLQLRGNVDTRPSRVVRRNPPLLRAKGRMRDVTTRRERTWSTLAGKGLGGFLAWWEQALRVKITQPIPQILPTTSLKGKSLWRNNTIPPKGSGATPGGCARAHPPGKVKKLSVNKKWSLKREPLKRWDHPFKGSGATVGYHKKGYPNQSNKNRKRQNKPFAISGARTPARLTPWPRAQTTAHPTPLASDASSASPDPSGPRTRVSSRLTPLGLGRQRRFARSPITVQGFRRTAPVPTTWQAQWLPYHSRLWWWLFQPPWSLQPYLFHYATLPLLLWCTASQWKRNGGD